MLFGHVFSQLAAYAEHQLNDSERARVERHLATCDECRTSLAEIRTGIAFASELRAEPMPTDLGTRIRAELTSSQPLPHVREASPRRTMWRTAAAALLVMTLIGAYWQVNRPWVQLHAASTDPTTFERQGRALHDRITSGAAPLAFESTDEQALWQWLASQRAPVTSMAISRPPEQRSQFVAQGAAVHDLDGVRTSVLSYRIDGRPVTLALASSRDVRHAPVAGWWSKRVIHRQESDGTNTLTWTVGGGTYIMVSELEGAGQKACLICHTTPRFAEAIARLTHVEK